MDPQDRSTRGKPVNLHGGVPLSRRPLGRPRVSKSRPDSSRCSQDVSKKPPGLGKTAPRGLQDGPRRRQDAHKTPKDAPGGLQEVILGDF